MELPLPSEIKRADLVEALRTLGIDLKDVRRVSIDHLRVEVEMLARAPRGGLVATDHGDAAINFVSIPVAVEPEYSDEWMAQRYSLVGSLNMSGVHASEPRC